MIFGLGCIDCYEIFGDVIEFKEMNKRDKRSSIAFHRQAQIKRGDTERVRSINTKYIYDAQDNWIKAIYYPQPDRPDMIITRDISYY